MKIAKIEQDNLLQYQTHGVHGQIGQNAVEHVVEGDSLEPDVV